MRRQSIGRLRIVALSGFALGLAVAACGPPERTSTFDDAMLESHEDLSESLANDLLAFSVAVRDRDADGFAPYWADAVELSPFPESPPPVESAIKWIGLRPWPVPFPVRRLDRNGATASLTRFLVRFREIDDARFKVKEATFSEDGNEGDAHIKFFLVTRNEDDHREWIKGTARIDVRRTGDGPWRMGRFEFETLLSMVAGVDLFHEVAFSAGVGAVYPPFGVGRNTGFVSHGAAVADVDLDGLLDLAVTGVERNRLYRNRGDGTFEDVGDTSFVSAAPAGSGAVFLDYDRDGDPDLFLANVGNQVLLENRFVPDGVLVFWDVSEQAGVARDAVGFSAVASDVDLDGLTDIYVCSYNRYGTVMPNSWLQATNGTPNLLFHNNGDGTFEEVGTARGVADGRWSYAASFVDIDEDGDQDLYVANDFGDNALYRNDGARFTDIAEQAGVVDRGFGMGVSFGDFDNDGDLDLHVTNMSSTAGNRILKLLYPEEHDIRRELGKQAAGNSLYENLGDGTFRDVSSKIGGLSGGWAFGGGFLDFDNDGWEDLYSPNGFVSGKTMKDT